MEDKKEVKFYGKVATFPDVQAHKAYAFLENIKVSKSKLWYILVQKQDESLTCVKYNKFAEMDLTKLVEAMKEFYLQDESLTEEQREAIGAISLVGEDKFVVIRNIPKIEIDGKRLVGKITEDIIRLLS